MNLKEIVKRDLFDLNNNKKREILKNIIKNCKLINDKRLIEENCKKIYIIDKIDAKELLLQNDSEIYSSIAILYVDIIDNTKIYDVYNVLLKNILYATFIIFDYKGKKKIGASKIRENMKDNNKNVNSNISFSSWSSTRYNETINKISKIDISDVSNMKDLYYNIYNIILMKQSKSISIGKVINIISNSFIVKDKEKLRKEIEEYCCIIYASKYKKSKYKESERTNIKCVEQDEVWDYLTANEYYSNIIRNKKIIDFNEINDKYNEKYIIENNICEKIEDYEVRICSDGREIVRDYNNEEFNCKMFDEKLGKCIINPNVRSYVECIKYNKGCTYKETKRKNDKRA